MSGESSRETMTQYLLALLDEGEFTRYLAPDVALDLVGTEHHARGREAVGRMLAHVYQEVFDSTHELRQLVCEGGQAVVEAQLTGKHVDQFAGICPTGREASLPYVAIYRLAHDLIEEIRLYLPIDVFLEREAEVQEVEHADI